MKTIENLLLKACGYTVSILALFYFAGTVSDFTNAFIDFKTFLVILLFGTMISLSELILKAPKLHKLLKLLIHYLVLFCAFTVIFVLSGNIAKKGAGAIFSSLIIFTFFYVLMFLASYFVRKAIKKMDKHLDKNGKKKVPQKKKNEYKSLYKEED